MSRNRCCAKGKIMSNYNRLIPDYSISRSQLENVIDEWIFNERDRKILKRRFLDGICYEPLAEEFDLSVSQIKNIVYKNGEIIFSHIN